MKPLPRLLHLVVVCLSYVSGGCAIRTSTYIRSEWPSVDIPLDNEVFAVPKGPNAPQQVHITQGDYDGKAVIVSWVTADNPGSSEVFYGTVRNKYDLSARGRMTKYTFYKYESPYIHHCILDDLKFDTKYYYKIGRGASSREFWFHTPPEPNADASYKFGVIGEVFISGWKVKYMTAASHVTGDLGQTYNSLSTLKHYMLSGAETVLFVGDLSYADRYQYNDVGLRWDTWGRFIEKTAAYQPWIWSAGNHEIEYLAYVGEVLPFKQYLQRYPTPYMDCKSISPLWYAIRRASAHIIVLSSYSPFVKYTPQWIWLRDELKRVNREKTPWLIILMHVPLYSSNEGHYMEGESMRVSFEERFIQHRVDVVFAGHVHAYERSYRISNIHYNVTSGYSYPVPNNAAPVYITVGDGGNQEGLAGRFRDPQPDHSAFREASYGYSTLEIKNKTHAFYHWNRNDDGSKVETDHFVLYNQYWAKNLRRRKLKNNGIKGTLGQFPMIRN